ncbi:MAG: hypothetical protein RLZZ133_868 [Pseudomonadota bacterium]|jgi:hypothetical protein
MTLVTPVTLTNINDRGHTWAGAGRLMVSPQALSAFALRAQY